MPGSPSDRTAGSTITSAWANSVRDQTVQPFANATARNAAITAPVEGQLAVTTDTDTVWAYDGSAWVAVAYYSGAGAAWTAYTPSVTASSAPNPAMGTGGIQSGRYIKIGRTVHVNVNIKFGTTGGMQASGLLIIGRPPIAANSAGTVDISGLAYNSIDTTHYAIGWQLDGYVILAAGGHSAGNLYISSTNFGGGQWAAGSWFSLMGTYEAIS